MAASTILAYPPAILSLEYRDARLDRINFRDLDRSHVPFLLVHMAIFDAGVAPWKNRYAQSVFTQLPRTGFADSKSIL